VKRRIVLSNIIFDIYTITIDMHYTGFLFVNNRFSSEFNKGMYMWFGKDWKLKAKASEKINLEIKNLKEKFYPISLK